MRTKARTLLALLGMAAASGALMAQTPTPTPTPTATTTRTTTPTPTPTVPPDITPAAQNWTIDGATKVNGARLAHTNDGSTWFMTPSTDQVSRLQGTTMTEWPLRVTPNIGANPVDLQVDGDSIWILENGESLIDAGKSIIAKLDTTIGALREWVLPTSRPANFYRAPDGRVWVAQSAGVLEVFNPDTLEVTDYRAVPISTFASGLILGPDGALWMTDFGNNRIVRHDMNDNSEKAWVILNPALFILNPSDMKFDADGNLWIPESSGSRVDRFTPSTGELRFYLGFTNPVHIDLFGGNVYVSEETEGNGTVAILDPRVAPYTSFLITPQDLTVAPPITQKPATIMDSVITPLTYTPTVAPFAAADLTVTTSTVGIMHFGYNKTNAYGLTVAGGAVWAGSDGFLVRLVPQTIGDPTDQTIPVALQYGGDPVDRVRVDLTLSNRGTGTISGRALFEFSAAAYPKNTPFTLGPGETAVLSDAFVGAPTTLALVTGSIRLQVNSGTASDLFASARSALYLDNSGSFGFALPAQTTAEILQPGQSRTLFTNTRANEQTTFGYFSPGGGEATVQLVAPDGTLRGTKTLSVESNVTAQYNPAASFFGVAPEPGDVLRVTVTAGGLQPWVLIQDPVTRDVAVSLPISTTTDAVIPSVASLPTENVLWTSTLQISNPDTTETANVVATYYPIGAGPSAGVPLAVLPGGSLDLGDVVVSLFNASGTQGAVVLTSDLPVAISQRTAAQSLSDGGQYAGQGAALDGSSPVPAAGMEAVAVPDTATRRTNLMLFNRGSAGTATINAFDAAGAAVGQIVLPIGARTATRVNRVLAAAGAGGTPIGRIQVTATAGMQLYAETVEVDAGTLDTDVAPLH